MSYWVKIQIKNEGNKTFYDEIDLDRIEKVRVQWSDNEIEGVTMRYSTVGFISGEKVIDVDQVLCYGGISAQAFVEYWKEYRNGGVAGLLRKWYKSIVGGLMRDDMEPFEPSMIVTGADHRPSMSSSWRQEATLKK